MNKYMNYKILLFLIIIPITIKSQTWYPIGATWYFNYQSMVNFPANGYTKYTVVKDTIIAEKLSKLINIETIEYTGKLIFEGTLIVCEEDSKVFYYKDSMFNLMYDFTLKAGDTLQLKINNYACDSISPFIVDSIKSMVNNGNDLRIQYISCTYYVKEEFGGSAETVTYLIIEKIGNDFYGFKQNNFLFQPDCQTGDQFVWLGLRCYDDNKISYKGNYWMDHFSGYPCDTIIDGSLAIYTKIDKYNMEIFPNPASDYLIVKTTSALNNIEIFNSLGKLVERFQLKSEITKIDLKLYISGIYFIIANYKDNSKKYIKFIKE
ncbi:MAG: T9SS type A sorting domain-containing protein [Bacteroidales bacterium]|nr:T9SS type A sorting domain-containing protein [Bacteroidales bacterium]